MAKQAGAVKRQRRERGSINPNDIIEGAFELAEAVGIDNLSMPLLGRHLGVGVTSIYWYFRKKDDLLDAMTDRVLRQFTVTTPYVTPSDWRGSLAEHAREMRRAFLNNPIACDLVLIRSALSARAAQIGVQEVERAVANLAEAGLSSEQAFDAYSAVSLHVRGSVVVQRLCDKNRTEHDDPGGFPRPTAFDSQTAPLLANAHHQGHRIGAADDTNFEYILESILNRIADEMAAAGKKSVTASAKKT